MALKSCCIPLLCLALVSAQTAFSQLKSRTALIPSGNYSAQQQRLADAITQKILDSHSNVELIDRSKTDAIIAEQNREHGIYGNYPGRYDSSSVARLGRLLGVPTLVFVRVDQWDSKQRTPGGYGKVVYTLTVKLQATAEILNVNNGAIIAAPHSTFEKVQQVTVKHGMNGRIGPIPIHSGDNHVDPETALRQLEDAAFDTVAAELAPKTVEALASAPVQPSEQAAQIPEVAGVQNNKTFLDVGSLKIGDKYQIVRMEDSGLKDRNDRPIMHKIIVCILTISSAEEMLSAGECKGDTPKHGDQAIRLPQ